MPGMSRASDAHPRQAPDDADADAPVLLPVIAQEPADDAAEGETVVPLEHDALTHEHLPHPRDPFEEVVRFAYTFDGYAAFGMEACGEMANRALTEFLDLKDLPDWLATDVDRLRACLYFEARRWILLERDPDTRALIYVHTVIEAIGAAIDARGAR